MEIQILEIKPLDDDQKSLVANAFVRVNGIATIQVGIKEGTQGDLQTVFPESVYLFDINGVYRMKRDNNIYEEISKELLDEYRKSFYGETKVDFVDEKDKGEGIKKELIFEAVIRRGEFAMYLSDIRMLQTGRNEWILAEPPGCSLEDLIINQLRKEIQRYIQECEKEAERKKTTHAR